LGFFAGNGPQLCGHSGGTVSGTQLIAQAGEHSSAFGFFFGGRLGLSLKERMASLAFLALLAYAPFQLMDAGVFPVSELFGLRQPNIVENGLAHGLKLTPGNDLGEWHFKNVAHRPLPRHHARISRSVRRDAQLAAPAMAAKAFQPRRP